MSPTSFPTDSVHLQIWQVIALLDDLPASPESGYRLDEVAAGFEALRAEAPEQRAAAEKQIWSAWCDHPEARARAAITDGIQQLSTGDLERAEMIFDDLVANYPEWAEAWNKRATLYFLQHRDAMSVIDIHRTLELEPRHFGALGGFAQICVRNGAPDAARRALLRLLAINPGAPGIAEAAAALADDAPHVLH
jgi:thioredoxin-like negative regulator of GroEL